FEILKGGECGVLFSVGDYKALGIGLLNLLENRLELKKYEITIEKRILEFKSDLVIKEYQNIIDKQKGL
ncbi:MAG: glycosyltransferase, partial [Clostridia bacterium]